MSSQSIEARLELAGLTSCGLSIGRSASAACSARLDDERQFRTYELFEHTVKVLRNAIDTAVARVQ